MYADPDGQRVYSAKLTIEINDRGDTRTFDMIPESPFADPTANHSQDYMNGVYYYLDTASIGDLVLEQGTRRYYMEFTDDWGRQFDVTDTVAGEATRLPAGDGNWIDGPIVSANHAPTLANGSVQSQDGTSNAATLWTYNVTYRDLDNDPPALIKVYLGLLEPDGRTILWDTGHTMLQDDPTNTVYSNGISFSYQTRLGAIDLVDPSGTQPQPKQYLYAFEAYDGAAWATYNSSAVDEDRSNAAGCYVLQNLVPLTTDEFAIRPIIAQRGTVNAAGNAVTPDSPGDIIKVWGVYQTENLDQDPTYTTNYYNSAAVYNPGDPTVPLIAGAPSGVLWIQYEAQSPIVGPLPINLPAPAGVIPDAQLYQNYSSNPTPILIDDQKNGWISSDDPTDHGVMVMHAVAANANLPTLTYVTPDSAANIASIEGIYDNPLLTGTNYYDPTVLNEPAVQTGTVTKEQMAIYMPARAAYIPARMTRGRSAGMIRYRVFSLRRICRALITMEDSSSGSRLRRRAPAYPVFGRTILGTLL